MTDATHAFAATLENFAAEVLEGSKQAPVLVDFWAPWCGPCRTLMPLLDRVVASYGGRVRLAKVNTDEQPEVAGHFGIRSIPTVMLFKDGAVVEQFVGGQAEGAIRALLDRHLPPLGPDPTLPAAQEAGPPADPAERAIWEANEHLGRHDTRAARAALVEVEARDPTLRALRIVQARIAFTEAVAAQPDRLALEAALGRDPGDPAARHALAAHHALAGDFATAVQEWLELLRRHPHYADELARRSLLQVFDVLGDGDELTQAARRRMAALLH